MSCYDDEPEIDCITNTVRGVSCYYEEAAPRWKYEDMDLVSNETRFVTGDAEVIPPEVFTICDLCLEYSDNSIVGYCQLCGLGMIDEGVKKELCYLCLETRVVKHFTEEEDDEFCELDDYKKMSEKLLERVFGIVEKLNSEERDMRRNKLETRMSKLRELLPGLEEETYKLINNKLEGQDIVSTLNALIRKLIL